MSLRNRTPPSGSPCATRFYLVIVIRQDGKSMASSTHPIAANSPIPTTPEEAMRHVLAYAGPLQDGDSVYVTPYEGVSVWRARGRPKLVLEREGVAE